MSRSLKETTAARLRYWLMRLSRRVNDRRFRNVYRVGLLISAAVIIDVALPGQPAPGVQRYSEGVVADKDVIAPVPFPVRKSEADLARERNAAAAAVAPIFEHHPDLADSTWARAAAFLAAVAEAASVPGPEGARLEGLRAVLERYRVPGVEAVPVLLSERSRRRLRDAVDAAVRELLRPGVVSGSEVAGVAGGRLILRRAGAERLVPRDSLPTMQRFYELAAARFAVELSGDERRLYQNIVVRFSEPTIRLNRAETEAAQDEARQAVDTVQYQVLRGEIIVRAHERVGPQQAERLAALETELARRGGRPGLQTRVGGVLINLMLLVLFALFVRHSRPAVYEALGSQTLLWILILAVTSAAAIILRADWPPEVIPVAFAALVAAALYDDILALLAVFVIVGVIAARLPFSVNTLLPALAGGATAALAGRTVRRRSQTWLLAVAVAAAYGLAALSLMLFMRQDVMWLARSAFWGMVNGVGCAILATGVLPLAESLTGITTDQSLLELADLNRPVLRQLSLAAPGTYAHSVNVANLAEAAARAIGANALLVRVGVYYHDIGKVENPQYFVENQPRGRNPHDKLKPAASAEIVRKHVRDGLALAERQRVPESVKAFIREHHGTQRIGFFWEQARELGGAAELNESAFRYDGPKPQSRETAIVLLADSVESAARVIQDPTPESIREAVERVVTYKVSEGQLDEAPLTLRELTLVKQEFVKVLTSMYHHRLDYPQLNQQPAQPDSPAAMGPY
jgi:putative nucleotidyltransferase with HDIG domain